MVETGEAVVHVPMLDSQNQFTTELRAAGVAARLIATAAVEA